jgi:hypothetical protein
MDNMADTVYFWCGFWYDALILCKVTATRGWVFTAFLRFIYDVYFFFILNVKFGALLAIERLRAYN